MAHGLNSQYKVQVAFLWHQGDGELAQRKRGSAVAVMRGMVQALPLTSV